MNNLKKITNRIKGIVLLINILILNYALPVFAKNAISDSKLIVGFKNLFTDLSRALLVVEVVFVVVLEIKEGMCYQAAQAQEKAIHKKNMLSILGIGAVIVTITGLVPIIFSYFQ